MMTGMVGWTFARYLALAFARTIMAVFGTMFVLIYLIDFVELLRRASDAKEGSTLTMAFLSLLRVPSIAEQILPFSILFGSMFAFLNLTRKLELVVARAAGVSVWQFLLPPLFVALMLGIFATAIYNPVSATSKQRAARLETRIFGQTGSESTDTAFWLQQDGVDGQTVFRADRASDGGTVLSGVTAFVYGLDGSFLERVEAQRAELSPGFWTLQDARVLEPGERPREVKADLIATNVSAEQVIQKFVAPDAVPFWDLPDLCERTIRAGLNATGYQLQYQALLARPLLFVAMVLVAASFSLRFFRFGGVARMVAGGVAAGFMLYVSTHLIADIGGAGLLSAPVAAWSPAMVGTMLGSLALLYQEDG
jgi:lipopolysaccharide export system permease protein